MTMNPRKLYALLLFACSLGYGWVYLGLTSSQSGLFKPMNVCLIKHVTSLPCPSCGSTRSVYALLHGNFLESVFINPFGILIFLILLVTPVWIFLDLAARKKSLFNFYQNMETLLKNPKIASPLIVLVLINWAWNITKGL